ncbi:MAG: DUF5721 family protein [Lachnospiraceae bacterium]|nr:DUF5721 family protein [Lachnospiraceae bacterium]
MIAIAFDNTETISRQLLKKSTFDSFLLGSVTLNGIFQLVLEPGQTEKVPVTYKDVKPLICHYLQQQRILCETNAAESDGAQTAGSRSIQPADSQIEEKKEDLSLSLLTKGQIVLHASSSYLGSVLGHKDFTGDPEQIQNLVLTFRITPEGITALTGISYRSFTTDKSMDRIWDSSILKAFDHSNIPYTLL